MSEDQEKLPYYAGQEDKIFKTLDEFIKYLDDSQRIEALVDNGAAFKFGQDANLKLQLDFGRGPTKFTERGFNSLCKVIKAPSRYIERLPYENQIKDLCVGLSKCSLTKINFITKGDKIVGVSSKEELVSTREVLSKLNELNFEKDYKEISYLNEGASIALALQTDIPLPNEVFQYGVNIYHDDSSGLFPELSHYLYRQVCSNGAKTTTLTKVEGFSNRMTKSKMFDLFERKILSNVTSLQTTVSSTLQSMNSMKINSDDKKYIKMFVGKKLGFSEHIDGYENFDKLIGNNTEATYYDLMNFITDFAKKYDELARKDKVETLGGNMLSFFKKMHPAIEPLKGFNSFKTTQVHREKVEA